MRRLSLFTAATLVLGAASFLPGACYAQAGNIVAVAEPQPAQGSPVKPKPVKVLLDKPFRTWAVGVRVGTLGAGVEAATPVTWKSNLRVGFNDFTYSASSLNFNQDEVNFNSAKLTLRSATANFDFFPIGPLHLSPGVLLYNGNQMTAAAQPAVDYPFTLNGTSYEINAANQLTGNAKLQLGTRIAPEFLIGLGNMVPRGNHHFNFHFEFGAVFQGVPKATLNLTGQVCTPTFNNKTGVYTGTNCQDVAGNPTVMNNIQLEQNVIDNNSTLKLFKYYPVISFGFSYKI